VCYSARGHPRVAYWSRIRSLAVCYVRYGTSDSMGCVVLNRAPSVLREMVRGGYGLLWPCYVAGWSWWGCCKILVLRRGRRDVYSIFCVCRISYCSIIDNISAMSRIERAPSVIRLQRLYPQHRGVVSVIQRGKAPRQYGGDKLRRQSSLA
jgi:hypothetical protein